MHKLIAIINQSASSLATEFVSRTNILLYTARIVITITATGALSKASQLGARDETELVSQSSAANPESTDSSELRAPPESVSRWQRRLCECHTCSFTSVSNSLLQIMIVFLVTEMEAEHFSRRNKMPAVRSVSRQVLL